MSGIRLQLPGRDSVVKGRSKFARSTHRNGGQVVVMAGDATCFGRESLVTTLDLRQTPLKRRRDGSQRLAQQEFATLA